MHARRRVFWIDECPYNCLISGLCKNGLSNHGATGFGWTCLNAMFSNLCFIILRFEGVSQFGPKNWRDKLPLVVLYPLSPTKKYAWWSETISNGKTLVRSLCNGQTWERHHSVTQDECSSHMLLSLFIIILLWLKIVVQQFSIVLLGVCHPVIWYSIVPCHLAGAAETHFAFAYKQEVVVDWVKFYILFGTCCGTGDMRCVPDEWQYQRCI